MRKLLKKHLLLISVLPLIANFLLNTFSGNVSYLQYLYENKVLLLAVLVNSLFYFQVSKQINLALQLRSISLSLVYFLTSFYIFNLTFMPIFKKSSFKTTLIVVLFIWLCFLAYKAEKKFEIIKIPIFLIASNLLNSKYYSKLSSLYGYKELNTDVPLQWNKLAELISSENLYYAFTNNIIEGQTLSISYIQSLLFNLNFYSYDFTFVRLNSNLMIIFVLFFIYDTNLSKQDKIVSSIALISFILNSDWLTYLFFDSLMLEGLVSLIFSILVLNIKNHINIKPNLLSFFYFLSFSFLLFTKQFVSTIALLTLAYLLIRFKNKNVFVGFVLYFLHKLYNFIYVPASDGFELLQGTSLRELLFDILTFDNLAFYNVNKVIQQLSLDKPFLYFLLIFMLYNLKRFLQKLSDSDSALLDMIFLIVIINFVLVFLLYIVWWKDFGIQSSYRYILNLLLTMYYSLLININLFKKKIKP